MVPASRSTYKTPGPRPFPCGRRRAAYPRMLRPSRDRGHRLAEGDSDPDFTNENMTIWSSVTRYSSADDVSRLSQYVLGPDFASCQHQLDIKEIGLLGIRSRHHRDGRQPDHHPSDNTSRAHRDLAIDRATDHRKQTRNAVRRQRLHHEQTNRSHHQIRRHRRTRTRRDRKPNNQSHRSSGHRITACRPAPAKPPSD